MTMHDRIQYLKDQGIIAIVRADSGGDTLVRVVEAVAEGGVRCIEMTMTTPGALHALETAASKLHGADVLLGVGSVLDGATARLAINAGAQYVVAPVTKPDIIETAHRYGMPALPGAYTPNEILYAWELGGDLIKVFPAAFGGLAYIKAVQAPMPQIPLVPTGGVNLDNLADFIQAGAAAVGIGSNLVRKDLIASGDFEGLTKAASDFARVYRDATR